MKTGRSLDSKAVKASGKCSLKTGSIGVKNSPKRTNKWDHRARGCEGLLTDKENQHFPSKEHVRMCPELPNEGTFLTEKREAIELHSGQALTSSAKIKLQLFPINEGTRIGLEKDGHNPYLELTLGGRKKISSVLKHLGKKWGSSRIAKGEPVLFPYKITGNLSDCRRWTTNDSDTTASAVHAAVGSPAIFRLKYGWFYIHELRSFGIASTPTPHEPGVLGGTEGGSDANLEETLCVERDKVEVTSKEYKTIDVGNASSEIVAQKMDNEATDPTDNEPRVSSSLQQSSFPWIDNLSNISIGGLLSEASLLGGLDTKSFGCNSAIQSDSLDAFIAAHLNHPPVPRLPAENLRTSILDAEETCHAFPLQKLSSSADVQTARGKDFFVACSQDVSSNSLKLPKIDKGNGGLPQNPPSGKSQTDLSLSSRSYDDERSLGLTDIKWNDSLGPFDLGMPTKKCIGGDGVSIGGFVK
ncbi:TSL-kinase interacting protein 1 isoform X1 [Abrus precatorius]|uniref:TSL-kinase interacting protein 1 isoform X1 n=1 Tax=Abrus precatorius TaxID=3816 RepID=A0A8B8MG86_ABRPR|nr:TSL-kinase interacting protein 1 isoform X1 [Abrus precatorius]XP_027366872.1 TSL-kinase interacting protein 1 isoform X1 [Abrus precatorius]XP_027366873.1 TSL-kinase interacting protein 1 isoform X1 [Abrus precatorius]XP_027366874.1 TSL-kinase interacting protein 1 isoform X1 [Abrus precatorius]